MTEQELAFRLLDLGMNGPISVGAAFASIANRDPAFVDLSPPSFFRALWELEEKGLITVCVIPASGETRLISAEERAGFEARYAAWLPGLSVSEAAVDDIGGTFQLTPAGKREWTAWIPAK